MHCHQKQTLLALMLLLSVLSTTLSAQGPISDPIQRSDAKVRLKQVANNMTAPHYLTHAQDDSGRLFVVDQAGDVGLIKNGVQQATPWFSTSSLLPELGLFGTQGPFDDYDERGLLGMAFHPDFANAGAVGFGKFYTHTSEAVAGTADFTVAMPAGVAHDHQGVIREWNVDPISDSVGTAATIGSREIMRVDQPQFNHNGGALVFGPDRHLYIGFGDGGAAKDEGDGHGTIGNGADTSTIHGSIVRINPLGNNSSNGQYGIPNDNPFLDDASAIDEIFAHGLRNPFQFNFDVNPADGSVNEVALGELFVADVGQNNLEEINRVMAGDNMGWRYKEGSFYYDHVLNTVSETPIDGINLPDDFDPVDPLLEYDHDEGLSVVGGYVYRGSEMPELQGKYIFGDFSSDFFTPSGRLFAGDLETGEILELLSGDEIGMFIKGIGRDADGELYVLAGTNLGPFRDANGVGYGGVFKLIAVPEPGSLAVITVLLCMMNLRRRRSNTFNRCVF